ncbi:MAG: hypothetical protein L3J28_05760 [Candidatus Polarisedimenticolaceae bacterium]|nr:hypothetical protein [Candidatus Polarisedimenticolaceae bacterium]
MMHVLIGIMGPLFFTLTPQGLGLTVAVVCCTQVADLFRYKREGRMRIEKLPEAQQAAASEAFDAGLKSALMNHFFKNLAIYSVLVFVMADLSRKYQWWN